MEGALSNGRCWLHLVQKVFGKCEETVNCCKPQQVGTKGCGKMLKRIQLFEDGRVPAKEAKTGRLKEKRGQLPGRNIEECEISLRWRIHGPKRMMESR